MRPDDPRFVTDDPGVVNDDPRFVDDHPRVVCDDPRSVAALRCVVAEPDGCRERRIHEFSDRAVEGWVVAVYCHVDPRWAVLQAPDTEIRKGPGHG
jgi:hypothetical protein